MIRILLSPSNELIAEVATQKGVEKFMKSYIKRNKLNNYKIVSNLSQIDENEATVYVEVN